METIFCTSKIWGLILQTLGCSQNQDVPLQSVTSFGKSSAPCTMYYRLYIALHIYIYIYKHIIKILSDSKTSRKNFSGNSKAHYEIHIMTYWSPHFSWVFFIPEMLVTQTKQFSCHGLDRGLGRLEVSLYCLAPGRWVGTIPGAQLVGRISCWCLSGFEVSWGF